MKKLIAILLLITLAACGQRQPPCGTDGGIGGTGECQRSVER